MLEDFETALCHCVVTPFWSGATGGENRFLKICGLTQKLSSGLIIPLLLHPVMVDVRNLTHGVGMNM